MEKERMARVGGRVKNLSVYSKQRFQCNTNEKEKPIMGHKGRTDTVKELEKHVHIYIFLIPNKTFLPLETALDNR